MIDSFRGANVRPAGSDAHASDDAGAAPARIDTSLRDGGPADDGSSPRWLLVLAMLLAALVGVAIAIDVADDAASGASLAHLSVEAAVIACILATLVVLGTILRRQVRHARRQAAGAARDLIAARDDAARWQSEARAMVRGLARAIDEQLLGWGLTEAERQVALLLLKGLSMKEIAAVRGTSERTVRQQSLAIYRKSGLAGRAELSAFFLEDLLVR
jgi:DNA-binding CsgD family transcriptional regulator